ncbi:GNAT family N-acetyltransferase [Nonlabens marinus]|uniref:Acetyltransferase, GNAT family n=1 Tax=Nonlabens marinus S1-08 TaxID=1454201 RepID=W8W069_9FLAO|nr:GNAT family N-acetyltransferase [Nonlabens marinus]BAO55806.1 acetyltransferase, GNAT family [Nonlabens marinus S1-08]
MKETDSYKYLNAKPDQISAALELLKIAALRLQFKQLSQWSYWLDPPQERLEWLKQGFENKEYFFLELDSKIIAMYRLMELDLKYWGERSDSAYYIHSLVVHPDYKGQGIGAQIIRKIHELAVTNHKQFLRLDCDASNPALCDYYRQLGFDEVGLIHLELSVNRQFQRSV